jgi:hypothetical protein
VPRLRCRRSGSGCHRHGRAPSSVPVPAIAARALSRRERRLRSEVVEARWFRRGRSLVPGGCAEAAPGGVVAGRCRKRRFPMGKLVLRPSHEHAQNGSNSPSGPGSAGRAGVSVEVRLTVPSMWSKTQTESAPMVVGASKGSCSSGRTGRTAVQRFRVSFVCCLLDSFLIRPTRHLGRGELHSAQYSELTATASTARGSCAGSRFCRRGRLRAASGTTVAEARCAEIAPGRTARRP